MTIQIINNDKPQIPPKGRQGLWYDEENGSWMSVNTDGTISKITNSSLSSYKNTYVVESEGNGDFTTIGEALSAVPDNSVLYIMSNTVETDHLVIDKNIVLVGNRVFNRYYTMTNDPAIILPDGKSILHTGSTQKRLILDHVNISRLAPSTAPILALAGNAVAILNHTSLYWGGNDPCITQNNVSKLVLQNQSICGKIYIVSDTGMFGTELRCFDNSSVTGGIEVVSGYALIEVLSSRIYIGSGAAVLISNISQMRQLILHKAILEGQSAGLSIVGTRTYNTAFRITDSYIKGIASVTATVENALPMYNCTLYGGVSNVTPPAVTMVGSNAVHP